MNSNDLKQIGQNICNAFKVVRQTHKSLDKLREEIVGYCESNKGEYCLCTDKGRYLRYNSDIDPSGWCYGCLILIFKKKNDTSNYRYAFAVDFIDCLEPEVRIAKISYGRDIGENISIADYYKYMAPLYVENENFTIGLPMLHKGRNNNSGISYDFIATVFDRYDEKSEMYYNHFECAIVTKFPLLEIANKGDVGKIFDKMNALDKIQGVL